MKFDDLQFSEIRPQHFQAKQSFGNYDLSVILEPGKKLYEIAVFKDNNFIQLPGIHNDDDVIPYLEPADVEGIMLKLHFIAGPN